MGTHPIFESDFDCLTECEMKPKTKRLHYCFVKNCKKLCKGRNKLWTHIESDHSTEEYLRFRTSTSHGYFKKFCARCGFGFRDLDHFDEHINSKLCDINIQRLLDANITSQYLALDAMQIKPSQFATEKMKHKITACNVRLRYVKDLSSSAYCDSPLPSTSKPKITAKEVSPEP